MALKIDITDGKGVKTRYHKIKSFTYEDGVVTVTMTSYVNQTTRDAEKKAKESAAAAEKYDQDTEALRRELDQLSAQLQPNGEGDPEVAARIKELSGQVNERVSNPNRPQYLPPVENEYDEQEVKLAWFEPMTMDALYQALTTLERYAGAEAI